MRIKVNLTCDPATSIPIEYNYNIYQELRRLLFEFLGRRKPKLVNKYQKTLPDFCFSQLMIPSRKIEQGYIEIEGNYLSFFLSSIDPVFVEYLVKALNEAGALEIHEKTLRVKKVEILTDPEFTSDMKFRMLSPLLLVKVVDRRPVFVHPTDADLGSIFSARLVEKYNALYQAAFKPEQIKFALDQGYVERRKNVTRLLAIRNVNYKAILSPFYLKGEVDLIKFAYHNGIGEKTQFGMGMIEVIS